MLRLADLGELRLLDEVLLPRVTAAQGLGDDCARLHHTARNLLWSIDPCPTPVAHWLGVCTPKVLGWYTALINLSDIAACGGKPIGMLVSLELRDDTAVSFVEGFYDGLIAALELHDAALLGGNVRSARKFSATGTIVGEEGNRTISRTIDYEDCSIYLIGECGQFWASVAGHQRGWGSASEREVEHLQKALLYPQPQVAAGRILAELPFQVACMDCSDGPANALFQLARSNNLDLLIPDDPDWACSGEAKSLLGRHELSLQNACYNFGDWQLACLVPHEERHVFEDRLGDFPLTRLGRARRGQGTVTTVGGRRMLSSSLNENFRNGYNSIDSIDELMEKFMMQPIFDGSR